MTSEKKRQGQKLRKMLKKQRKEKKKKDAGGRMAPPAYHKKRGNKQKALAIASDPLLREDALKHFKKDMKSAGDTSEYNMVTWHELHEAWWAHEGASCIPPILPLTTEKIWAVGSLLKAADYRSGSNYIDAAKDRHLMAGHEWSTTLDWAYKRFNMSVSRGMGPPKQAEPLPFDALHAKTWPEEPVVKGGPVGTGNLITLFTHWLVRDMEGALAMAKDMHINTESQTATWRLCVSKTDPKALGCERAWGYLCPAACPYHAALDQQRLLQGRWPEAKFEDLPLFPNAAGKTVHKDAMLALIERLAQLAGEPIFTAAGQRRYGRHSWRSAGAVY